MSNGWFDPRLVNVHPVERCGRGILRGLVTDLVDHCLGQKPPHWRVLSMRRIYEAFEVQQPGLLSRDGVLGHILVVRVKPFRAWARRNRMRFTQSRVEQLRDTLGLAHLDKMYRRGLELVQNDPFRCVYPGDNNCQTVDAEMRRLAPLDQEEELRELRNIPPDNDWFGSLD